MSDIESAEMVVYVSAMIMKLFDEMKLPPRIAYSALNYTLCLIAKMDKLPVEDLKNIVQGIVDYYPNFDVDSEEN